MPQDNSAAEPRVGSTYNYDGTVVRLTRRHDSDRSIWIAVNVDDESRARFVGQPWLIAHPPLTLGAEAEQAGATALPPNLMEVVHAEPEVVPAPVLDVLDVLMATPAPAPTPVSPTCPACRGTYRGQLGINHECAKVIARRCLACQMVTEAILVAPLAQPFPYICEACVSRGMKVCRVCAQPSTAAMRTPGICNRCTPLMQQNIWEALQGQARGNDIIAETLSHRPFAIECECFCMPADARRSYILPGINWDKVGDGSISADAGASHSAEFRSPPLRGDGGLEMLRKEMTVIREMGYRANKSCGLHVHVDAIDMKVDDLKKLNKFGRWIQDDIFKLVAPSRTGNRYCGKLGSNLGNDRYKWLNLKPSWDKHRTVEFRIHHGITNPDRVVEWVKICLLVVEHGLRYGTLSRRPTGDIFELLGMTKYQRDYWMTVARNLREGQEVRFGAQVQAAP